MLSATDQMMDLLMEFLQKARAAGFRLKLRDIEGILPKLGIPLGEKDHFILLLSDFEQQGDNGCPQPLEELLCDYPHWNRRIRDHLDFAIRCRQIGPSILARILSKEAATA